MKIFKELNDTDHEVMKFFESLRSIVVEYTYVDENGILSKKVKVLKDRECSRFIGKDFCVCEFGDLHKLAVAYNSCIFEAPEGIDLDRMNLWILMEDGGTRMKISQTPYFTVYKKQLIPNSALGMNPYNTQAKEWESSEGIGLLIPEFLCKNISIWLYDCYKGSLLPIKMESTSDYYKIKVVNLSNLYKTKDNLLELLKDNMVLIIVIDIREIQALFPCPAYGRFPMISEVSYKPVSSNSPYESNMNNVHEC